MSIVKGTSYRDVDIEPAEGARLYEAELDAEFLRLENEKLRGLVRDLKACRDQYRCEGCPHMSGHDCKMRFGARMEELGVVS